jgi:hypothetical protein
MDQVWKKNKLKGYFENIRGLTLEPVGEREEWREKNSHQ